jgi:hypothetical protein
VACNEAEEAVRVRRDMEAVFHREWAAAPGGRNAAAE